MAEGKRFLSAADVAEIMECSKSQAYAIMRQLNAELKERHYVVIHGRVNAKYFFERVYDGKEAASEQRGVLPEPNG